MLKYSIADGIMYWQETWKYILTQDSIGKHRGTLDFVWDSRQLHIQ